MKLESSKRQGFGSKTEVYIKVKILQIGLVGSLYQQLQVVFPATCCSITYLNGDGKANYRDEKLRLSTVLAC